MKSGDRNGRDSTDNLVWLKRAELLPLPDLKQVILGVVCGTKTAYPHYDDQATRGQRAGWVWGSI